MNAIKLYRLLQTLVGALNHIVIALYKEEIAADDAQAQATKLITDALKTIGAE